MSKICAEPITGDQRETHVEYFHLVTTRWRCVMCVRSPS